MLPRRKHSSDNASGTAPTATKYHRRHLSRPASSSLRIFPRSLSSSNSTTPEVCKPQALLNSPCPQLLKRLRNPPAPSRGFATPLGTIFWMASHVITHGCDLRHPDPAHTHHWRPPAPLLPSPRQLSQRPLPRLSPPPTPRPRPLAVPPRLIRPWPPPGGSSSARRRSSGGTPGESVGGWARRHTAPA